MLHTLLKLERPLVSIDVESTGTFPSHDRIIQLGVVKMHCDGRTTEWESLFNPEIRIPAEATEVHGITDATVENAPHFRDMAARIEAGLKGCDLVGYNLDRFDVPMLTAEFRRASITWAPPRIVDAYRLWQRQCPRNLETYVREFATDDDGRPFTTALSGAHNALWDARMTMRGLAGFLTRYPEWASDVQTLHDEFFRADPSGLDSKYFAWRHGEVIVAFGKHAGQQLRMLAATERGFLQWMLRSDFPDPVKQVVQSALNGQFPVKAQESRS